MSGRFAPDYRLQIDDRPMPAALRAAVTSVNFTSALEGADRVEVGIANQYLRWTDHPLLKPGTALRLSLGYSQEGFEQVFVGEVVSTQASFPADGLPTLTVAAQDRFERLRESVRTRWFAVPIPFLANRPIPDLAIASLVSLEHGFIPVVDPVGAVISVILYGAEIFLAADQCEVQKLIRRQSGQSDLDFLGVIAKENGWEMLVDHSEPNGGQKLRFMSPMDDLEPVRNFAYGRSLIDWSPRLTTVGVLSSVTAYLWVPAIKTTFEITVGWNWDNAALEIDIRPAAFAELPQPEEGDRTEEGGDKERRFLLEENLTPLTAPRRILSELIPSLNGRITGSGSVIGDPALIAGRVVQLEGLGEEFGGRYRITSATHSIDSGGYRTSFEGRKEIWFGSIPLPDQGAWPIEFSAPLAV